VSALPIGSTEWAGEELNGHVGVELTQGFVKVIHLRQDADNRHQNEDICARVGELVAPAQSELHSDTDALDSHDGDGADGAADAQVYKRVLAAIPRSDTVDHDGSEDNNCGTVEEKGGLDGVM